MNTRTYFSFRHGLLLTTAALVLAGCNPKIIQIEMDPLEFAAFRTPDGMKVQAMDPELLFKDGAAAFKNENYALAAKYFAVVAKRFPESTFAGPALYNLGTASLRFGRPKDAVTAFSQFIDEWPDDDKVDEVRRRLIEAMLESGDWADAETIIRKMLAGKTLTIPVQLEMKAGLAKAVRKQGRLYEARQAVGDAMTIYDANVIDPDIKGNYHAGMATFEDGEVWHDLFSSIKFILPKDRMEKDLSDKGAMFLKAQAGYLRTVRIGNIYWASRAGMRIGQLYEEFYKDVMNGEIPPELKGQDLEDYKAELRNQTRPMLKKSIELYEKNMKTSQSYGAKDEWFADAKTRLNRLKKILRKISKYPR